MMHTLTKNYNDCCVNHKYINPLAIDQEVCEKLFEVYDYFEKKKKHYSK